MAKTPRKFPFSGAIPCTSMGRWCGTVWSNKDSTRSLKPARCWEGGPPSGIPFNIRRMQWIEGPPPGGGQRMVRG